MAFTASTASPEHAHRVHAVDATNTRSLLICLAMVASTIAIFVVDLWFQVGVAAGVPYIIVVLLSRWFERPRIVLLTTLVLTALTVIGYFLPLPEGPKPYFLPLPDAPLRWIGIENRLIALFTLWTTAILVVVLIRRNQAIHRERDFNKSLVETASSVILLVEPSGKILYWNPYTSQVSGLSLLEDRDRDWIETLVAPEDQARVRQIFANCVTRKAGRDAVFSIVTPQRDAKQFSWTSHVTTGDGGQVVSVLLIGHDMTPLIEAQQALVQSERLAAIGQTVASLSHEVRNELHALQIGLLLLEKQTSHTAGLAVVERLKDVGQRLARLFEDIRGFAAPIVLERSTVSVREIWRKAWADAMTRHASSAELIEKLGNLDCQVSADALRLEQVFRNLFDNSLAVCTAPAVVTVTCSTVAHDDEESLQIRVQDNGPGLSHEAQLRVFEPFFTTKSKGTGLGMAIARRILEAHGGELRVGSGEPGAEFILRLPLGESS